MQYLCPPHVPFIEPCTPKLQTLTMVSRSRSHDVQLLETTTVSQIRSTIHITSLSDVLSELIQNALDASASRIECSINLERWGVTVGDNGVGMDKKAVEVVGGRYGE